MATSRRQKAARGVLLVIALKVTGTAIARFTQLVLPLFLLPTDMGLFALAVLFSGFLLLVADMGLSTDLLRRKERVPEVMNTAFTLRLGVGLALLAASVPLGWGASWLYGEPLLALPVVALSLGLIFHALALVPRMVAARELDFARAMLPDSAGKWTTAFATIAFAILGFAYWSPIYGTLLGYVVGTVSQLAVTKWRPRLEYHPELARSLLRFGRYVTLATFASFVALSLDTAVVGLVLGVDPLGVYAFAVSWGVFFTSNLSLVFSSVAYPVLAEASDAPARLRRAFLENLRYYTYLAVGLSLGVVILAPTFVAALYEAVWQPAVLPMQVLAIGGLLLGYVQIASDTLYALGRPKTVFAVAFAQVLVLLALLAPATLALGILGTALSVAAGTVAAASMLRPAARLAGLRAREGLALLAVPLASGGGAVVVGFAATAILPATVPGLLVSLGLYLGAYVGLLQLLSRGTFLREIRGMLRLAVA